MTHYYAKVQRLIRFRPISHWYFAVYDRIVLGRLHCYDRIVPFTTALFTTASLSALIFLSIFLAFYYFWFYIIRIFYLILALDFDVRFQFTKDFSWCFNLFLNFDIL